MATPRWPRVVGYLWCVLGYKYVGRVLFSIDGAQVSMSASENETSTFTFSSPASSIFSLPSIQPDMQDPKIQDVQDEYFYFQSVVFKVRHVASDTTLARAHAVRLCRQRKYYI